MTEIINLRRARKAKTRSDAEKRAAQNRATFGLSKSIREKTGKENLAASRFVEGHRLQITASKPGEPDSGDQSAS
jgi:hypothetical protein